MIAPFQIGDVVRIVAASNDEEVKFIGRYAVVRKLHDTVNAGVSVNICGGPENDFDYWFADELELITDPGLIAAVHLS